MSHHSFMHAQAERLEQLRLSREAEQRRLASERADDRAPNARRHAEIEALNSARARASEWAAHVECSSLPAPESDADLNTYMSILDHEPPTSLHAATIAAQACEDIVHRLGHVWASALEERQPVKIARCIEFASRLRAGTSALLLGCIEHYT